MVTPPQILSGYNEILKRHKNNPITNGTSLKKHVSEIYSGLNTPHAKVLMDFIRSKHGGRNDELNKYRKEHGNIVENKGNIPREAELGIHRTFSNLPIKLRKELVERGHKNILYDYNLPENKEQYDKLRDKVNFYSTHYHPYVIRSNTHPTSSFITHLPRQPKSWSKDTIKGITKTHKHELGHVLHNYFIKKAVDNKDSRIARHLHNITDSFQHSPIASKKYLKDYDPKRHNAEHFAELHRHFTTAYDKVKHKMSLEQALDSFKRVMRNKNEGYGKIADSYSALITGKY